MEIKEIATDIIVFGGVNFIRYPESKTTSDRRYYKGRWRINGKLVKTYLHRVMWMEANGPIPDGYHIHHKDHNHLNNVLENFECITALRHLSDHYHDKPQEFKDGKTQLLINVAQEAAKAWHKSDEGREWHKAQGRANWVGRVPSSETCTVCGKVYETRDGRKGVLKYCSIGCNAKARRASGLDNEVRACLFCGNPFTINKYQKTVNCSKSCAAKARVVAAGMAPHGE